jgi:hypothetical protein
MSLQNQIETRRAEIRTDDYAMSIGEWINIYESGEIDIHPEFQRFFRWSQEQKTKLIESILLGIPIPPVFVSQRSSGFWDVVDGVQRLSTIYEFAGILKDEDGNPLPPLELKGTRYLPDLEGKKWKDEENPETSFTQAQRLYIKRSKIGVSILEKESEQFAQYELFQRLNTGGSLATPQEVRNCILVMYDKQKFLWMRELADDPNFKDSTSLTDRALEEQYDVELVLRFLIFKDIDQARLNDIGDLGDFLTEEMIGIAEDDDYNREEHAEDFRNTFELINDQMQSDAFRRYEGETDRFLGGFSVSAFETVAMGIGHNINQIRGHQFNLRDRVVHVWENTEFTDRSGSGIRASTRIPYTIPIGREAFRP